MAQRFRGLGRRSRWLAVLVALIAAGEAAAAPSSRPALFPVVDGRVTDVLVDGSTAYVGGSFERVGTPTGPLAVLSAADAQVIRRFPGFTGHFEVNHIETLVRAIEPDGAGGWYVGGEFLRVDGRYRTSLVHLRADGSVDPHFRADVEGTVHALALDREEGILWVGGHFWRVSGEARSSLVALDAATGAARPWLAPGLDGEVNDIDVDGERVYVGGGFHTVAGDSQTGAAALGRRTGELIDWDPRLAFGWVNALAVHDGVVYLTGTFSETAGENIGGAVAVRASDAELVPVGFGGGGAQDVVVTEDAVILAGIDGTVRDGERRGLAAFDRRTGVLLPWFRDVDAPLAYALEASGGRLYAAGVRTAGGRTRDGLAAFDLGTGEVLPWRPPGTDRLVRDIAVAGENVAVGGHFRLLGGVRRTDVAAIDLSTQRVIAGFDARVDSGGVHALALGGGSLWLGGGFARVGGQDRRNLARVDPATGALGPAPPEPNLQVDALHVRDGRLYLGGVFWSVGGQERLRAAAVDLATGELAAFDPGLDCPVVAFAPLGAGLLAGGASLPHLCGAGTGLALVDPVSGAPAVTAVPAPSDPHVYALAPDGEGGAWVGGGFVGLGDAGPPNLGRVRADGSLDPRVPAVDRAVHAIARAGAEVYVGGMFERIEGEDRYGLAAVGPSTGAVAAWDPRPLSGRTEDIVPLADGGALVGGWFDTTELAATRGLARFGPARAEPPPSSIAAPTVGGDRNPDDPFGGAQRTDGGDWSGAPLRRHIRWLRCDAAGNACLDSGRQGWSVRLLEEDEGHRLRVEVVAYNDGGASAPVRSAPGPLVVPGASPEATPALPEISGEAREGVTLSASPGGWTGEVDVLRYRWMRCGDRCHAIDGATAITYTLTAADINDRIHVTVRALNAAGEGIARSLDTEPVLPAAPLGIPQSLRPPAVLGTFRNPTTLFPDWGEWNRHAREPSGWWERCAADGTACERVQNGGVYEVRERDAGYRLRIATVTGNTSGSAEPVHSALTPIVPAPEPPSLPFDPPPVPEGPPPDGEPPPEDPGDPPPTGGNQTPGGGAPLPAGTDAPEPGGAPPAGNECAAGGGSPAGDECARRAASAVRVLGVRVRRGGRLVIRLRSARRVRARVTVRLVGRSARTMPRLARRPVAHTAARLRPGRNTVRLRLTRPARRRLARHDTLVVRVKVAAGIRTLASTRLVVRQ
jgi:hypothetical protein